MTTEDKKISSLYQQANSVEPPSHLDDIILTASRDAVTTSPCVRSPFSGGWPISMVAVVIVAVIVVPIVIQESSQQDTVPVATTTPVSPPAKRETVTAIENRLGKAKLRQQSEPVNKSDTPARSMPAMMRYKESADREVMSEQLMQAQPAAAPALAAPGVMSVEEDSLSEGAGLGRLMKQSTIDKDTQEKKSVDRKNSARQAIAKSIRPADEWLKHINKLITDNRLEEARVEWKAFEQSYPDHPDNKKLKELLIGHE